MRGVPLVESSAEHCAITVEHGLVRKYLRPCADLSNWEARAAISCAHDDLFARTVLEDRVALQNLLRGPTPAERFAHILAELRRRRVRVGDIVAPNIVRGLIVDFSIPGHFLRPKPPTPKP